MVETNVDDLKIVEKLQSAYKKLRDEIGKIIVGQEEVLEQLLICIFSRGHCLIVGVPGLAKTLMIRTLAQSLSLSFSRIQFTPDLMPSDITGTEVIQEDRTTGERVLKFIRGPIFANIILADEINRTPPKTQAALLECMQEYQVTVAGKKYELPQPFFVLATQNPIEQEGTYPLPEAQLDRFMFNILIDYPKYEEEIQIVKQTTVDVYPQVQPVLSGEDILALQTLVRKVPASDAIINYAVQLVRRSRVRTPEAYDFVKEWVSWGAGPRAIQYLVLGAKARALLKGRLYVSSEDVKYVAYPVLRHRIITNYSAEAEGIKSDNIIKLLIEKTQYIEDKGVPSEKAAKIFKS
jgi:MoxR-like ATPase